MDLGRELPGPPGIAGYDRFGIHDMRNASTIPKGALTYTKNIMDQDYPDTGEVVVVGASRFLQSLYSVFSKLYPSLVEKTHFRMANTMDEAYALIEDVQAERRDPSGKA